MTNKMKQKIIERLRSWDAINRKPDLKPIVERIIKETEEYGNE